MPLLKAEIPVIRQAVSYTKEHFQGRTYIGRCCAGGSNYSPYYVSRLFQGKSGAPFIEYLTKIRIDEGKRLLWNQQDCIRDLRFGRLPGSSYFTKVFKKREGGVTPTQFRR